MTILSGQRRFVTNGNTVVDGARALRGDPVIAVCITNLLAELLADLLELRQRDGTLDPNVLVTLEEGKARGELVDTLPAQAGK